MAHELLHIFGAWDMYETFRVTKAQMDVASRLYPNSVMLRTSYNPYELTIDPVTGWRIGWCDKPDNSLNFFDLQCVSRCPMFPTDTNDAPLYFRVDVLYMPNAISTSAYGSIVETPPVGIAYRPVHWAVVDTEFELSDDNIVVPHDLYDALNSTPWHENGFSGDNVKIAVFDVEWMEVEWPNGELGSVQTHDCFAHPSCELPIDSTHPRFGFERGVHGFTLQK